MARRSGRYAASKGQLMKTERARSGLLGARVLIEIPLHRRPHRLPKFRQRRVRGDVRPGHDDTMVDDLGSPVGRSLDCFCLRHKSEDKPKYRVFQSEVRRTRRVALYPVSVSLNGYAVT